MMLQRRHWYPIYICNDTASLGPDPSGNFYNRTSRLPIAVINTLLPELLLLLIQSRLWAQDFLLYTFAQLLNVALCGNAVRHSHSSVCSFLNLILY